MVTRRKQDLGQGRSTIYAFVWRSSSPVRTGRIEKVLPSKRMLSVYDLALTGNSVTRGIIVGNIFSRQVWDSRSVSTTCRSSWRENPRLYRLSVLVFFFDYYVISLVSVSSLVDDKYELRKFIYKAQTTGAMT